MKTPCVSSPSSSGLVIGAALAISLGVSSGWLVGIAVGAAVALVMSVRRRPSDQPRRTISLPSTHD